LFASKKKKKEALAVVRGGAPHGLGRAMGRVNRSKGTYTSKFIKKSVYPIQ
jgi:hypothetical protein